MVHTSGWGDLPKFIVPEEFIDPQVEVLGDLHGKVEQTQLLDIDLTDASQYPQMDIHTFMDFLALPTSEFKWEWKPSFIPLCGYFVEFA
jgi:hypothetical protein